MNDKQANLNIKILEKYINNFNLKLNMPSILAEINYTVAKCTKAENIEGLNKFKDNRSLNDYIERVISNYYLEIAILAAIKESDPTIKSINKIGADAEGLITTDPTKITSEPDYLVIDNNNNKIYIELQFARLNQNNFKCKYHKIKNREKYNNYYILAIDNINKVYGIINPYNIKPYMFNNSIESLGGKKGYIIPYNKDYLYTLNIDCFLPIIAINNNLFIN